MSTDFIIGFHRDMMLAQPEIESVLRYSFDELGCSRVDPERQYPDRFRYSSASTEYDLVENASIDDAIAAVSESESGVVWCWYEHQPVGLGFNLVSGDSPPAAVSLLLPGSYGKASYNEHPSEVRDLTFEYYDLVAPLYVYGDTFAGEPSPDVAAIKRGDVADVFWANGFGPSIVEEVGRERLLDAPAWRVDELDDGGVFLWTSPLPVAEGRPETTEKLREYFGLIVSEA